MSVVKSMTDPRGTVTFESLEGKVTPFILFLPYKKRNLFQNCV